MWEISVFFKLNPVVNLSSSLIGVLLTTLPQEAAQPLQLPTPIFLMRPRGRRTCVSQHLKLLLPEPAGICKPPEAVHHEAHERLPDA